MEAFNKAQSADEPFPYFLVNPFIDPAAMTEILEDFPAIEQGGSFPATSQNTQGALAELLKELESDELRESVGKKFNIDLSNRSPMMTLRGYSRAKDGEIHTDSKSKCVTFLIYLNPEWEAETGRLRLLYSGDALTPYAAEVPPTFGSTVVFKVTDNCWHGYEPFAGVRRSIQLNYMMSQAKANRYMRLHKISAWFKKLLSS